jgi:hypothetical protein
MYWKSKKKIYGIDNELQMVEQIQKCMKIFNSISKDQRISHEDIIKMFEKTEKKSLSPKKQKKESGLLVP